MRFSPALYAIALLSAAPAVLQQPVLAQQPVLEWPLDCALDQDCWLAAHVDHDDGPGARDYACGAATRDGHKGVDIAIANMAALEAGVAVRAAAAGRVLGVRDGMVDRRLTADNRAEIEGRECGNGVVIGHGGGWETQYCHLREGSLAVTEGETVEAGALLGEIGLSGMTNFPHLHLSVRRDGRVVEPFTGDVVQGRCVLPEGTGLWAAELFEKFVPQRLTLTRAGVASEPVELATLDQGGYGETTLGADGVLVLWAEGLGLRQGDLLGFTILDDLGNAVFSHEMPAERSQDAFMRFSGSKSGFAAGAYRGAIEVRGASGEALDRIEVAFELR